MEVLTSMHPAVALLLGLVVLAWLVLLFLVPFMVEGIRGWTRKNHEELEQINAKLDRLTSMLARRLEQSASAATPASSAEEEDARARREPTISDYTLDPDEIEQRRIRSRTPGRRIE